ncbi:MAG: cupin domain-containing protein [Elusimicrobia bacterium]|nr:cupin domain-containing protein [Elusimicrobiota bacterium]
MTAEELVRRLDLAPHPEGGFYRETYRAKESVETARGARPASTAILYLLPRGQVSRLHRIKSDELWHFHLGSPLKVVELAVSGARESVVGPDSPQHAVGAGTWFGAEPLGEFALVGCTVAPGFDFADFELGERAALVKAFPAAAAAIARLTR